MRERERGLDPWLVVIPLAILILLIGGYSRNPFFAWTGFGEYKKPDEGYEQQKTLWDWMDLLIVPAILAGGGLWFNQRREKQEQAIQDSRNQEESLQRYLDRMTELLLNHNLSSSQPDDGVRRIARSRTLSVLRTLSSDRNGVALRFLRESELIGTKEEPIVPLDHSDLRGAKLEYSFLSDIDLDFADLRDSKLQKASLDDSSLIHARLNRANLRGACLERANLRGAHLLQANLEGAKLEHANLLQAKLDEANLRGAILEHANLQHAELQGANLKGAQLKHAYYSATTGWPTDFDPHSEDSLYAISPDSDLTGADLQHADLGQANLRDAILKEAMLQGSFLGGANLENANLEGAHLKGALYTDNNSPKMSPAVGSTIFPKDFDPKKAGMVLVTTLEDLPRWYRGS